ncbi:uncharacterized protein L199_004105 [Kwoniella botswanensis]|uniref:uncharacterized protein n=1 Tax=Kwoniella botswanensis TaxID=1268659 RepID=UPI00315D6F3C
MSDTHTPSTGLQGGIEEGWIPSDILSHMAQRQIHKENTKGKFKAHSQLANSGEEYCRTRKHFGYKKDAPEGSQGRLSGDSGGTSDGNGDQTSQLPSFELRCTLNFTGLTRPFPDKSDLNQVTLSPPLGNQYAV